MTWTSEETQKIDELRREMRVFMATLGTHTTLLGEHVARCETREEKLSLLLVAIFGADGRQGLTGELREVESQLRTARGALSLIVYPSLIGLFLLIIGLVLGARAAM